jgi:hypothetical protein
MRADPTECVDISPAADTLATDVSDDVRTTTRSVSPLPSASNAKTTAREAAPSVTLPGFNKICTALTGTGATAIAVSPISDPLTAIRLTAPVSSPTTSPVEDTVAMTGLEEDQVIGALGIAFP